MKFEKSPIFTFLTMQLKNAGINLYEEVKLAVYDRDDESLLNLCEIRGVEVAFQNCIQSGSGDIIKGFSKEGDFTMRAL